MLRVLIKSASARRFWWVSQHMFSWRKKYHVETPSYQELWIITWKRAKMGLNIFYTSRLKVDDRSVLQNWWSAKEMWPISKTICLNTKSDLFSRDLFAMTIGLILYQVSKISVLCDCLFFDWFVRCLDICMRICYSTAVINMQINQRYMVEVQVHWD